MIGIENQFVFDLRLHDGRIPIMEAGDILSFGTSEQVGNDPPHFNFKIRCADSDLTAQLQDGRPVDVTFGVSSTQFETFKGYPLKVQRNSDGRGTFIYDVAGTAGVGPSYYAATKTGTSKPRKSEDIARTVASRYFNASTDLSSNSQQVWMQPSISDKQFLDHLVERASAPGGWVASAIGLKGNKWRLEDMTRRVQGDYDWRFTLNPRELKDVMYVAHHVLNRGGMTNAIAGYGRQLTTFDTESGSYNPIEVKQLGAFGPAVKGFMDLISRAGAVRTRTPNMHPEYHQAQTANKVNAAAFSAYSVMVSFRKTWRPFQPLDTVLFLEDAVDPIDPIQSVFSNLTDSGLFVIDSIENNFVNSELQTKVYLTRSLPGS